MHPSFQKNWCFKKSASKDTSSSRGSSDEVVMICLFLISKVMVFHTSYGILKYALSVTIIPGRFGRNILYLVSSTFLSAPTVQHYSQGWRETLCKWKLPQSTGDKLYSKCNLLEGHIDCNCAYGIGDSFAQSKARYMCKCREICSFVGKKGIV